ncbi:glutathione S-transferase [Amylocarpus encephaloides]|uniref:Glutathione S-transferase n=1 Tax=Amylocarpus encephaloides TaxID=45428 RepID=A0A9P7YSC7_9HELO|nr:glutathione S-transferase [Amylocarpus encephaloides]
MKKPEIQFYYAPGACSLAPHILLREAGLDFEGIPNTVTLDTVSFTKGFAAINPKMRVPVISTDGEVITETAAVCLAVSNLAPEFHLMGKSPLENVRVHEWMNWLAGTLHGQGYGGVARPERWTDEVGAYDGIRMKAREHVEGCYGVIEGRLRDDSVWAVGERLTCVDVYLFVFWRWGKEMGVKMEEGYPRYTALVRNLAEREAVRETLEVEGIESRL